MAQNLYLDRIRDTNDRGQIGRIIDAFPEEVEVVRPWVSLPM